MYCFSFSCQLDCSDRLRARRTLDDGSIALGGGFVRGCEFGKRICPPNKVTVEFGSMLLLSESDRSFIVKLNPSNGAKRRVHKWAGTTLSVLESHVSKLIDKAKVNYEWMVPLVYTVSEDDDEHLFRYHDADEMKGDYVIDPDEYYFVYCSFYSASRCSKGTCICPRKRA